MQVRNGRFVRIDTPRRLVPLRRRLLLLQAVTVTLPGAAARRPRRRLHLRPHRLRPGRHLHDLRRLQLRARRHRDARGLHLLAAHAWAGASRRLLALVLVLLVLAPLLGALIERVLIRPLYGAPVGVTAGRDPGPAHLAHRRGQRRLAAGHATRVLPKFFAGNTVKVAQPGRQLQRAHRHPVGAGVVAVALRQLLHPAPAPASPCAPSSTTPSWPASPAPTRSASRSCPGRSAPASPRSPASCSPRW